MQFPQRTSETLIPSLPLNSELLGALTPQGTFCAFSSQLERISGWSDSDWLGKPLQFFVHPEDISAIRARFPEILAGRTAKFDHIRCLVKGGGYVSWALSLVPQNEKDRIVQVLLLGCLTGTPGNVAQTEHPLEALRLSSQNDRLSTSVMEYAGLAKLLEGMLGNAPIGFALMDQNLHFICVNQSFAEMTGFSPAQQLGRSLGDLLPAVAVQADPILRRVLTEGEAVTDYEAEFQLSLEFELYRCAQMSFYPIPDLHGGVCGVATIAVDITERKVSEARLRKTSHELARSNQALAEFSYIASHDLKEPLRTISSFIHLLGDRYRGRLDHDATEYITFAIDGADRMQRLIEKLLEYSRAGTTERRPADVDCDRLMHTILDSLKSALEESDAHVTCDRLPTIRADESLLAQIFQNLVANGIKYRRSQRPEIAIRARKELNTWVFSVEDNGIGIESDQFLNIFAPFRKLHSTSEYAGSGLGLAICQKNAERLGGRIWVTSTPGAGSVFSFTVPALPLEQRK